MPRFQREAEIKTACQVCKRKIPQDEWKYQIPGKHRPLRACHQCYFNYTINAALIAPRR